MFAEFDNMPVQLVFNIDPAVGFVLDKRTGASTGPVDVSHFLPMCFNQYIGFGRGKIDDMCAWAYDGFTGKLAVARDSYYFAALNALRPYASEKAIYFDMETIFKYAGRVNRVYDGTRWYSLGGTVKAPDLNFVGFLWRRAAMYGRGRCVFFNAAMHIYMGMIAENNKAGAILGSRVKLNGIYDILLDNMPIDIACCRFNGCTYKPIEEVCNARGIVFENID